MKRILVSGGAGLIGSHLYTRLISKGHDVIYLDNFFTGSKENIIRLIDNHHFEVVRHDITFLYGTEVDEVYNPACPASPIHYQYGTIQTTETSVMGAINMLGLARRFNTKILQASTSEVCGDPEVHPQPESYWGNVNPTDIRSYYDEGKCCSETLFIDYHRQNNVHVKIVRAFNTYGPRVLSHDGRVVSNFVIQALKNDDITIYGTNEQTRNLQYIDGLVEGIIRVMNTDDDSTGPINLGNPSEFSMLQLTEMIIQKTGSKSKVTFKPLPHDNPQQRKPDISLAQERLGRQPTILLDEGLDRMINCFKRKYTL